MQYDGTRIQIGIAMIVTVSLKSALADDSIDNVGKLLAEYADRVKVLKIFGAGQFANIEVSREQLVVLRDRLGHACVFSEKLAAQAF